MDASGDGLSSDEDRSKGENGESGETEHSGDGTGSECVQRSSVTGCWMLDVGWLGCVSKSNTQGKTWRVAGSSNDPHLARRGADRFLTGLTAGGLRA